jgi:hypothetical protein
MGGSLLSDWQNLKSPQIISGGFLSKNSIMMVAEAM